MKIEKVKDGTSRRRYVLYLSAVLLAVMMLSCAIIIVSDDQDVDATADYNIDSTGAVTVYSNKSDYDNKTNGTEKTLRQTLSGQDDNQYWVFKAGIYNVTKACLVSDYASAMVIVNTVTLVGAVDGSGQAATTLYADYATTCGADWEKNGYTGNELISCMAFGKTVTIENMNLMPMVYLDKKYGSGGETIPGFEENVATLEDWWYTPNCVMTYSCNLTMTNVNIKANTLGQKSVQDAYNCYMMDDGGNCQNFNMGDGEYTSGERMTVTFTNVTSCGGFSFNKQYANISMTNVTVNVGGDNNNDGKSEIGDQRALKLASNPASGTLKANFTKMENVVFNIKPCDVTSGVTMGHNTAVAEDTTNLLAMMLVDWAAPAFNDATSVTINLDVDSKISYNTTIPANVNVVNNGTMTVLEGKTLTVNGIISGNGNVVNNGTANVKVMFDANGGTGDMADQVMSFNTATALTANAFTRDNYRFVGWNTAADGSGTAYTDAQSVALKGSVTLYAQWAIAYTIAFNANGGTGEAMGNLDATGGVDVVLTANTFSKDGYAFGGWATTADGKALYSDKATVKNLTSTAGDTVTLYAVWIQIEKTENAAVVTVTTDAVSDQAADQLVNAAKQMKDAGTENVSVDVKATETESVSIKSDSIKEAVDSGIGVNIATSKGSMEFSSEALAGLLEDGKTLKSEIKEIEVPPAYAEKIPADAKVFSISLTSNDTAITSFNGKFTVKVAYTATGSTDNLYVGYLAADGTIQKMESHYEDGFMVFTTDHLSDYAILEESSSANNQGLLLAVLLVAAIVLPIIAALIIFRKK